MKKGIVKINDLIAVYTDINSKYFGVGLVLSVNDDFLVLNSVDSFGQEDGLILYRMDEVIKIEKETLYLEKIKSLMEITETTYFEKSPRIDVILLLDKAKGENIVVDIQLMQSGQSDVVGFVKEINNDYCVITQIDNMGVKDGECIFDLHYVSSIKYNSRENRILKKLSVK